jgi:hypothetical protein
MHLKKVRKQRPEAADIGPTPEALCKAEFKTIAPPRNTSQAPICRKEPMHNRLEEQGKITSAEWTWADRYCEELERMQGARPGKPEVEVDREYHGPAIYDRQAQAATFVRQSDERLGARREVFISACVQAHRVCDVAIVCGIYPDDDETMAEFSKRVDAKVKSEVVKAIRAGASTKGPKTMV